jgi:poly(A) polymerase
MPADHARVRKPESRQFELAERLVRRLQDAGHEALLAGGCVRDLVLAGDRSLAPALDVPPEPKDYDVATSAEPGEVAALFPCTMPVGAQFGVILVVLDHLPFQVATFRTEDSYRDGRRPDRVRFSSLEEDAARRDFTINGMYWDPVQDRFVDLVGGLDDLTAGLVRAIGDPRERLREDHLRILRAVRFAARFGFRLEGATRDAVAEMAPLISKVSAERVQEELRAILTDRDPGSALRLMDELGLLALIFPELEAARGCEQPPNYHPEGDVFVHSILSVEKLGPRPDFVLALASLLHDLGKPAAARAAEGTAVFPEHERIGREIADEVCRRLRMSREETERVCWLVHRHMYLQHARQMKDSTLKRMFAEPGFEQLIALARADALASWGNMESVEYVLERRRAMPVEEIEPPRLVTGHDLIAMGYEPGPEFGQVLERVREMQLEGKLRDREQALAAAQQIAREIEAPRRQETPDKDGPPPA